jgi:hypothetical protein
VGTKVGDSSQGRKGEIFQRKDAKALKKIYRGEQEGAEKKYCIALCTLRHCVKYSPSMLRTSVRKKLFVHPAPQRENA